MTICLDSTLEARLLKKVTKTEGCWLWAGATVGKGYGTIGTSKGVKLSHRVAYELYVGPIPEGLFVLHRCDTPNCVNPEHLFVGTNQDNMTDMMAKGRGNKPRGTQVNKAKLTDWAVKAIRTVDMTANDLADIFSVSPDTIYRVRNNRTWKHL